MELLKCACCTLFNSSSLSRCRLCGYHLTPLFQMSLRSRGSGASSLSSQGPRRRRRKQSSEAAPDGVKRKREDATTRRRSSRPRSRPRRTVWNHDAASSFVTTIARHRRRFAAATAGTGEHEGSGAAAGAAAATAESSAAAAEMNATTDESSAAAAEMNATTSVQEMNATAAESSAAAQAGAGRRCSRCTLQNDRLAGACEACEMNLPCTRSMRQASTSAPDAPATASAAPECGVCWGSCGSDKYFVCDKCKHKVCQTCCYGMASRGQGKKTRQSCYFVCPYCREPSAT